MRPILAFALAVSFWIHSVTCVVAHPVSVTRTFVFVSRERVTVRIEVFLEDLFLFHDLRPNDQDFLEPAVIQRGIELHKKFVATRFTIRDVAGERLEVTDVRLKEADLPDGGVPLAELMAHNLTFELRYDNISVPEFLTFTQLFTDENAFLPSEMSLQVKQENAGMAYSAALLPDKPVIVRFNWDNPPLASAASDEEWEEWFTKQKEATLGITSYSSVYSFLYIEDYEVRHEILIPLLTLEKSVPIARNEDEFLDLAEQDAAREPIEAYFRSGNPVEIDGVKTSAVVERCDFYGLDFRDFAQQRPRKRVSMINARVGIILSYKSTAPPRAVKLTWTRFSDLVWSVNTVVFACDGTSRTTLSRVGKKNVFEWESPGRPVPPPLECVPAVFPAAPVLSLPMLSLFCLVIASIVVLTMKAHRTIRKRQLFVLAVALTIGIIAWPSLRLETVRPFASPVRISDQQANTIFALLHQNVYRAFKYREESALYDALALSIHGDLLRDVYLQICQGLEMQEQGGALSRVREVTIVDGESGPLSADHGKYRDERGFAYRCRWNVMGTVEHWGHLHERTNQYEASFDVEPVGAVWKITQMQIVEEKRIHFETRLRGL